MKKGELFRVQYAVHGKADNSYLSDVFLFHAEDDRIAICSKVDFTTGRADSWVHSFYKNHWNFNTVGPEIQQFIQDRLTKSTTTEAATV